MKKLMMFVVLFGGFAQAQDLMELRAASNRYRFVDWSHTFHNKLTSDIYYVGIPGNNELSICGGYQFQHGSLSLTPFVCGVMAKENWQAGVKVAVAMSFQKKGFNADAYYAHFTPLRGKVQSYDVLDATNLTHNLGKSWELGVSAGFFRQEGAWGLLVGPVVRRNDHLGAWSVSFRQGSGSELRFGRTFILKR